MADATEFPQESIVSTSRNYGAATGTLQRIEDLLRASQSLLRKSEYYDFQSRLYSLRQSAQLELSKGEEAVEVNQAALKLENEISNATKGEGKRSQLEAALLKLETDFAGRRNELSFEDASHLQEMLSQLKNNILQHVGPIDERTSERCMQEIRDLESKLTDRVLFGSRRKNTLFVRKDVQFSHDSVPTEKQSEKRYEGQIQHEETINSSNSNGNTTTPTQLPRQQKKVLLPIPKIIEKIENELIEFHEKNQIGTFDMDSFTERLLAQKKNLHVMMSKTGRISARQDALIREDLEKLGQDITDRILGKD